MHIFFVVLLFIFIRSSDAQIHSGNCPKVETVTDFALSKHLGEWYLTRKYPFIVGLRRYCTSFLFTAEPDNKVGIQIKLKSGDDVNYDVSNATGIPDGDIKDGKLNVTFESDPDPEVYSILGTDYDSYSVVWICTEIFLTNNVINVGNAYILTRERNPPKTVITKAIEVMEKNKIETRYLTEVDQKGC